MPIRQPNLLLIVADDLGAGDTPWSAVGAQHALSMPNMAHLKQTGLELTQHYVQPSCAPTRSSLMTGRISNHLGTQNGGWHEGDAAGLPLDEVTLAENLREAGYETAIFGKWHLGYYKRALLPTARGFDRQEGYFNAAEDYYTHQEKIAYDWNVGCVPALSHNGTFSDYLLRDAAVAFLLAKRREAERRPWFMYLPWQAVHAPLQVPSRYLALYPHLPEGSKRRLKAGMLSALDDALGAVLAALNGSAALAAATLTVLLSDNGAQHNFGGSNLPFRGWKHQLLEGGIRTPAIVHAADPQLLPPARRGAAHGGFFHVTDWLPTLVRLANGSTARNKPLDGYDIWPYLVDGAFHGLSPRTELFHCDVDENVSKTSMEGPQRGLKWVASPRRRRRVLPRRARLGRRSGGPATPVC